MSTELERRLDRLESRAALEDLVHRYFLACDDQDYDTLEDAFAVDAEFVGANAKAQGRDEIMDLLRSDRGRMGTTIHSPDFTLLAFSGDARASGIVSAHCELARSGKTLYGAMRYLDEYVREAGTWRFARRAVQMIHVGPWEDAPTSLTTLLPVRWTDRDPQPADLPAAVRPDRGTKRGPDPPSRAPEEDECP